MDPLTNELARPRALTPSYKMERDVRELIQKHVDEAKEEVVKMAIEEFTRRVRKIAAETAIMLQNYYSVEKIGQELIIRVKIDDGASKP